jgi:hypothetical protein
VPERDDARFTGETPKQATGDSPHGMDVELPLRALSLLSARSGEEPLTVGQIGRALHIPADEAMEALQFLCELRLARRLNTLIGSYVAAPAESSTVCQNQDAPSRRQERTEGHGLLLRQAASPRRSQKP